MELECGGHKGGWMRIADLGTSRGDDCPSGSTKITTNDTEQPSIDVFRTPSDNGGCYLTIFTVNGTSHHKICGKARGYTNIILWMLLEVLMTAQIIKALMIVDELSIETCVDICSGI